MSRLLLIVAVLASITPLTASASPAALELFTKRSVLSLPAVPAVGLGFVGGGDLLDASGAKVGDGFSHCGIVQLSVDLPPAIVAHCTSTYRLRDGELVLSSTRTYRPLAMAFDDCPVAVVGGTGAYASARGDGRYTKHEGAYKVMLTIT